MKSVRQRRNSGGNASGFFDLEDEVKDKRDRLITKLETRMTQKTQRETIFTIRWKGGVASFGNVNMATAQRN